MPIHKPYDPDSAVGTAGWIWTNIDGKDKRWYLVTTFAVDAGCLIRFVDQSRESARDLHENADLYRLLPYMPCDPPAAEPGDCDAALAVLKGTKT